MHTFVLKHFPLILRNVDLPTLQKYWESLILSTEKVLMNMTDSSMYTVLVMYAHPT